MIKNMCKWCGEEFYHPQAGKRCLGCVIASRKFEYDKETMKTNRPNMWDGLLRKEESNC